MTVSPVVRTRTRADLVQSSIDVSDAAYIAAGDKLANIVERLTIVKAVEVQDVRPLQPSNDCDGEGGSRNFDAASFTCTVKLKTPAVVGVPEMVATFGFPFCPGVVTRVSPMSVNGCHRRSYTCKAVDHCSP